MSVDGQLEDSATGGTSAEPVLWTEELVAGYIPDVDILRGCSVEVRPGELIGIIGPNGAGKSTLIKAMFGLVPVRSGRVMLHGEDITSRPAHKLWPPGWATCPRTTTSSPRSPWRRTSRWASTCGPRSMPPGSPR